MEPKIVTILRRRHNNSTALLKLLSWGLGIDSIIYYASQVFESLGLTGGTQALLATGVTGVVFLVFTIPAMLVIDRVGRKPMLLVGSVVMCCSMVITGIIVAKFRHNWPAHAGAGWTAVAFIWIYIGAFGATWGPASWTLISEIFPLSIRMLRIADRMHLPEFMHVQYLDPRVTGTCLGLFSIFGITDIFISQLFSSSPS